MKSTKSMRTDSNSRYSYPNRDYDSRQKTDYTLDTRKRPIPNLDLHKNALNLRVVYPHTIFVVGVANELDDPEVRTTLQLDT
jgi:hypothetical protein